MEAKISRQSIGLKSLEIEDTEENKRIISNMENLNDFQANFTLNLSEDSSKLLKDFLNNLPICEEYVKQQDAIENVFACGGYLSLFDIETDSYIRNVHSMNEYMSQNKFYNFIPYNKDGQIVDLYTLKPVDLEKLNSHD